MDIDTTPGMRAALSSLATGDMLGKVPHSLTDLNGDGEYTWLVDLDKDRKQDILMHHPSTTEPHRVTMLIAR